MRNLKKDIENRDFKKVYLFYGEEEYLKKQYKERFKQAVCEENSMNYSYFEGKDCNVSNIKGMCETLPFFADKRLVIVENSGFFKNANDEMSEYVEKIPDFTCVIFVESQVDKRNKLYKKVGNIGYICEMNTQNNADLERWISDIVSKNNKSITRENIQFLLERVGSDMEKIYNELEKLICYCMDRGEIKRDDIAGICSVSVSARVFDLIDAMGIKNRKRTMDIYNDLIALKEPPMRILFMMSRQFNIMLQIGELNKSGENRQYMSKAVGVQPFVIDKVIRQLRNFTLKTIKEALDDCLMVEEDMKNGRLNENVAVEMILVKYSS